MTSGAMLDEKHVVSTRCPRCDGLLYWERIPWAHSQAACANCGNRLDAQILANRHAVPLPAPDRDYPRHFPQPFLTT